MKESLFDTFQGPMWVRGEHWTDARLDDVDVLFHTHRCVNGTRLRLIASMTPPCIPATDIDLIFGMFRNW